MRVRHRWANEQSVSDPHSHSKQRAAKEQFTIAHVLSWSMFLFIPLVLFFSWKKAEELSPAQALKKRHSDISRLVNNTLNTFPTIPQAPDKNLPKWSQQFEIGANLQPNEIFIGSNGTELIGLQKRSTKDLVLKRIEFMTTIQTKDNEKVYILNNYGTLVGTSEFQSATTDEIKDHPAFKIAQRMDKNTPFTITEVKNHEGSIYEIGISKIPGTNLTALTETSKSTFVDYPKKLKTVFLICCACLICVAILTQRAWKNATRSLLEHADQVQFSKLKMQNFVLYLAKNSRNSMRAQTAKEAISNLASSAFHGGIVKDITGIQIILPSQFLDPLKPDQSQTKFHFERTLEGKIEVVASENIPSVTEETNNTGPQTLFLSGDCMFMRLKVSGREEGFLICSRQSFSDEFRHNMDLGLLLMRALSSQLEMALEQVKPETPFTAKIAA